MDDILLRVFSVIISVLILFILPLYITFEKIDDISYSLALKITSNFVDNVNAKGYLTQEMYDDFISRLSVTGMVYDVKMEHVAKKYSPVYYANINEKIDTFDYSMYALDVDKAANDEIISLSGIQVKKSNLKYSYGVSEIKYTNKQILNKMNSSDTKAYLMTKGDEFNVRIKNENTTIATILFNLFTVGIGGAENNTRVYVNYGGTISEEEYIIGDVNLDNKITNDDKILLQKYISEVVKLSDEQLARADVNFDGMIDLSDVNRIEYLVYGL